MILTTFMLLVATVVATEFECQTIGVTCIDERSYQECIQREGNLVLSGNVMSCPNNTICYSSSGTQICVKPEELTANMKIFSENLPNKPSCSAAKKKYPAESCYQYYECKQVWWWWEPELKTCQNGFAYDDLSKDCVSEYRVNCKSRFTLASTASPILPPITEPNCESEGKHSALHCYQYFECVKNLWKWKAELKSCPAGQAFDRSKGACVCAGLINCTLPDTEYKCNGPSNYSSTTACNEYYACTKKLWWWEPQKKQCPFGNVFDKSTCQCVADIQKCTDPAPKCYGFWKYPTSEKNRYYECVLSESGLEWIPVLKTCQAGYIFLQRYVNCVPSWFILIPG